jgi:hypothetical protein
MLCLFAGSHLCQLVDLSCILYHHTAVAVLAFAAPGVVRCDLARTQHQLQHGCFTYDLTTGSTVKFQGCSNVAQRVLYLLRTQLTVLLPLK